MPVFPYRCTNGHEWDERRDRDDSLLDYSQGPCPDGEAHGRRVMFFEDAAPAVYYHGMGWARVDKNYPNG